MRKRSMGEVMSGNLEFKAFHVAYDANRRKQGALPISSTVEDRSQRHVWLYGTMSERGDHPLPVVCPKAPHGSRRGPARLTQGMQEQVRACSYGQALCCAAAQRHRDRVQFGQVMTPRVINHPYESRRPAGSSRSVVPTIVPSARASASASCTHVRPQSQRSAGIASVSSLHRGR